MQRCVQLSQDHGARAASQGSGGACVAVPAGSAGEMNAQEHRHASGHAGGHVEVGADVAAARPLVDVRRRGRHRNVHLIFQLLYSVPLC